MEVCSVGRGMGGPRGRRVRILNGLDRRGLRCWRGLPALWVKSIPGMISFNPLNTSHQNLGGGMINILISRWASEAHRGGAGLARKCQTLASA